MASGNLQALVSTGREEWRSIEREAWGLRKLQQVMWVWGGPSTELSPETAPGECLGPLCFTLQPCRPWALRSGHIQSLCTQQLHRRAPSSPRSAVC